MKIRFDSLEAFIENSKNAPLLLLRENGNGLSADAKDFFYEKFIPADFNLAEIGLDETLADFSETALSETGYRFYVFSSIISSYNNRVFYSFTTDRLVYDLANLKLTKSGSKNLNQAPWRNALTDLTKDEAAEIFNWLVWLILENPNLETDGVVGISQDIGGIFVALQRVCERLEFCLNSQQG